MAKPRLLVHVCCAPDALYVFGVLKDELRRRRASSPTPTSSPARSTTSGSRRPARSPGRPACP
ncbi:MAG: hypothetical protein MZV64_10910 [Ignavibacteriales bacterium]|nr:hypothetical protein [Ignavibacteriales bacterium]